MPQGNQLDFKSINESVEKYAIVGEDYIWTCIQKIRCQREM